MSDLVGNPKDRFTHKEAHLSPGMRKPVFAYLNNKVEDQHTVMILCFRTHGSGSGKTVQTQGLHYLLFHFDLFDVIQKGLASFLKC